MEKVTPRFFMGIDPGKSGGAALISENRTIISTVKFSASEHDIAEWFENDEDWLAEPASRPWATIESVHSMPRQGVRSVFTFGQYYGFVRGLLVANKIPFDMVNPVKWQREIGCLTGGNKRISYAAAQRLFPDVKMTHAIADALLIAEYTRRTHAA